MDARELIIRHEALRLKVYDDATGQPIVPGYTLKGHPTVGYGRALDVNGLAPHEADFLLDSEIPVRLANLKIIFAPPRWEALGAARQAALLDMHFALGASGIREFHQTLTALLNQQWDDAAAALLASKWAKDEAPTRAQEDAQIIREGVFPW